MLRRYTVNEHVRGSHNAPRKSINGPFAIFIPITQGVQIPLGPN